MDELLKVFADDLEELAELKTLSRFDRGDEVVRLAEHILRKGATVALVITAATEWWDKHYPHTEDLHSRTSKANHYAWLLIVESIRETAEKLEMGS